MQIVIYIDTVDYEYIKNGCIIPIKIDNHIYNAIRNGTPLPNTLEYLETAYTGARACDDVAEQVRLARAIAAYKQDVHEDCTVLDKIRAEIERQEKWLLQAGYTAYNVDIAFDAIKAVIAESDDK